MSPFVASSFFPLSRGAREEFAFSAPTFSEFSLARELAAKLNATRDLERQPKLAVKSGRLAAAALLDEIFAYLIARYCLEVEPDALEDAASFLDENVGARETAEVLGALELSFSPPAPPLERPDALEFLLRLHLANSNPALETFQQLFDDAPLQTTSYVEVMNTLSAYFQTLPAFGPHELDLLSLLRQPILQHPDSIELQLRFISRRLGELIKPFEARLLLHLDLIREEEKPVFFGAGPSVVPTYEGRGEGRNGSGGLVGLSEYEAFSSDTQWMPRTVLLAKQTYVWLDQMSKRYGRHIARLDQVPDEELDEMASRGITGLWLIGVWERSKASQKIKRMTGNPDAISSAYSLKNYEVAGDLGGWDALDNLKSRAAKRGIRMASDMVPNHTGLDSDWMMEHPDWFLSLPHPPFPVASFDGPDLSDDGRAGIYLENGYYLQTDASVVFRRLDRSSGENRFVYHGNDGTNMPWNDTAQLDYLKPEVRSAVMQTILAVARHFPIIRFDAAMTLAKTHIHRLWFPAPGSGGDIPSRAGRGVSSAQFDAIMPQEFWREVVDTVAAQVPGTLLLAEAFWMMEGYFVRTLGMHRVYNSAFMNMLRDEENANYRLLLRNTLEFDRHILGRFVNFMNNPDEDTASSQFGKGDKYFAVATLLATMPGLPMWGHGQIEGFEEKYGMEYPRAYWNEVPDAGFILHHERVIFPLLRKRALFAGSENFRLFDLWNGDGYVDEDVFAFSNRLGEERALVLVNNRSTPASGWLHRSGAWLEKGDGELRQQSLVEALGLSPGSSCYVLLREVASGLEFIRSCNDIAERGLYVELPAYGTQVFWNWREVRDEAGLYAQLAHRLNGEGVPSIERALRELLLEPLDAPFRGLCDAKLWRELLGIEPVVAPPNNGIATEPAIIKAELAPSSNRTANGETSRWEDDVSSGAAIVAPSSNRVANDETSRLEEGAGPAPLSPKEKVDVAPTSIQATAKIELERRLRAFARAANVFMSVSGEIEEFVSSTMALVERALNWPDEKERPFWLGYALLAEVGRLNAALNVRGQSRLWADEWLLAEMVEDVWRALDLEASAWHAKLQIALAAASVAPDAASLAWLNSLLADDAARSLLKINNFEQTLWFNQEGALQLMALLRKAEQFENAAWPLDDLALAMEKAEFRVVRWMENARGSGNGAPAKSSANAQVSARVPAV